jgi:hypothetical protein
MAESDKEYTLEEVAQHTSTESCWLIIGNPSNGEWFTSFCQKEFNASVCRSLFNVQLPTK